MAKSTAHKALAALKHKMALATHKLGELAHIKTELGLYKQIREGQAGIIRKLQAELQEFRSGAIVRASEFDSVKRELDRAEVQVLNLQCRNAALRSEKESAVQSAYIYGILGIITAFAAGIAVQHWFPINL